MTKNRSLILALSLLFASACAALVANAPARAAAQKPIPQECVDACRLLLYNCIAQGENDHRCIAVYRGCIAQCK